MYWGKIKDTFGESNEKIIFIKTNIIVFCSNKFQKRHDNTHFFWTLPHTNLLHNQQTSDNWDVMDVCLCSIENENSTKKIIFSGAKRSLFYYNAEQNELIRIVGSRKGIGGSTSIDKIVFANNEIVLQKNDFIYLTSDGYADQNNEERKRLGTKKLKSIIIEIVDKSLEAQKQILETELDNWQQKEQQRDDITIIGIKL